MVPQITWQQVGRIIHLHGIRMNNWKKIIHLLLGVEEKLVPGVGRGIIVLYGLQGQPQ